MLDLKNVAANFDSVVARLKSRGPGLDLGPFQTLVTERKDLYVSVEALQAKRNLVNEEMKKKAKDDPKAIEAVRGEMRQVSDEVKKKEARLKEVEEELSKILLTLPNVPHESVPVGESAEQNQVVRTWGEKPNLPFAPKQHFELGEKLGMLDFERAAKVSGSRFVFEKGALAKLERALVSFMIDLHNAKGYIEILPPYLVNRQAMTGTGQLPKFEDDAFKTAGEHELLPDSDRRGPGDELPPGRDPRRRPAPAEVLRVLALLPRRGRLGGQGHPRADPRAPVPQGRARAVRDPGVEPRASSRRSSTTRATCCGSSGCTTG